MLKVGRRSIRCTRCTDAVPSSWQVLDNRNYAIWKFYGHSMDSLGFPAECDARDMDVIRVILNHSTGSVPDSSLLSRIIAVT